MTKRATTILIGLVLLTLGGLVLVSNFISEPKAEGEIISQSLVSSGSPKPLPSPSTRPVSKAAEVTQELQRAQEQLQTLSDAIRNGDWEIAEGLLATFELKDHRLPTPQLKHPDISSLWQDFFDLYVVQLERAINEKQARAAHVAVNQLIGIVSETQARFEPRAAPVEVQRLRHLVRELALWHTLGDERMLRVRSAALGEAWNDVSPLLQGRKQGESLVHRFETLLPQVQRAAGGGNLTPLLPELNTLLEQIEASFQPGTARDGNKLSNDE